MSNYPHSTSLSTSPYAIQNNLEALIQRSRLHPHTQPPHTHVQNESHTPSPLPLSTSGDDSSIAFTRDRPPVRNAAGPTAIPESEEIEADIIFPVDSQDGEIDLPEERDDSGSVVERGRRGVDLSDEGESSHGHRSRWRIDKVNYGSVSAPLAPPSSGRTMSVDTSNSSAGNSRSRSKGRTPPRKVVRPMTRHPVVDSKTNSELSSSRRLSNTGDVSDAEPAAQMRRGRTVETRPISRQSSPVSVRRVLPLNGHGGDLDEGSDEDITRLIMSGTRGMGFLPAVSTEPLRCDPAEELDAEDLGLPTNANGLEVHEWKGALKIEVPLLLKSAIPVFLAQLAEWSLSLASVISIGHLGTDDLAASSLANMTAAVSSFSILQGLATALDTLLPAAWTSPDPTRVGLWSQRMTVVLVVSMIPMYVLWWNVEAVLLALNQDPEVARLAGIYLRWLSIGIPGYGGNVVLKKYLQAQNLMHIPTYVLFIVAPCNLLLNWLLVWGPESIRLGFIGGAVATAISFNMTCILLLYYTLFVGPREAFYPLQLKSVFSKLGTVTSLGLAGTIMLSSEWWAWEACALAASLLGPTSLAAQSVLLSTCSTLYQAPNALGIASAVRVGNLLGAGRGWEAKWASRGSFMLGVLFALVNSSICLIFRHSWGYLFNDDHEVVALVASIMPYIALFQVADGTVATANAVLRALGLHSTGAIVNLTSYYVIGLPFGLWLMFSPRFDLGLMGIWIGLSIALIYAAIIEFILVWRADWNRGVERVRERLGLPPHPGQDVKWGDEGEEWERQTLLV